MTVTDYLLLALLATLGLYTGYRLFVGWRNSTFRPKEEHANSRD